MVSRNYYQMLQVSSDSSAEEIKQAFRRLARDCHPDLNPGDPEAVVRFQAVSEAYRVLGDDELRTRYDRGELPSGSVYGAPAPSRDASIAVFVSEAVSVVAERIRRAASRDHGRDLEKTVTVGLVESARATDRTLSLPRDTECTACAGTGTSPDAVRRVCSACNGAGRYRVASPVAAILRTCRTCDGRGEVLVPACEECGGAGLERVERRLAFTIPAGVRHGKRLRWEGAGEPGRGGGTDGDLIVVVEVEPHSLLVRRGDDVECELPLPWTVAALGGQVRVPTLDGVVLLDVPPGTRQGDVLRLQGAGFPAPKGSRGDALFAVTVEAPVDVSDAQRALLSEFEASLRDEQLPRVAAFRDALGEES